MGKMYPTGEHKPLKLGDGKELFVPFLNTSKNDWSADGRVD